MERVRAFIEVGGIVQGVGFRPFIHKLIETHDLSGWIRNTSSGAEMEVEGRSSALETFLAELESEKPRLAQIEYIRVTERETLAGYEGFRIVDSRREAEKNTFISPDVCICEDCLRELFDKDNKRYRFPFINCTNCGPRFTIVRDVPYDREKTTMSAFDMCPDCMAEYTDIESRRYHAQPNCCGDCGPKLFFVDADGNAADGDPVAVAQRYLRDGKIVAVKGLGGFHLACRMDSAETAQQLRKRKHRDEKPFAVMCADVQEAKRFCVISAAEEKLLTSIQRPIVLLRKKDEDSLAHVSENNRVGVLLPYTPVHCLLLDGALKSLIMTSANLSDRPILFENEQAMAELRGIADGFLMSDRDIHVRCDDSLLWTYRGDAYFARRSRGYAPAPISVPSAVRPILACGAEQKASFSLSKNGYVFPSQHIGDLKNLETLEHYRQQIAHFENLFDIRPEMIVCDLHPDYLSSAYACERSAQENIPLLRVQHHFAHMASCMADNALSGKCIGVIWDGAGYGDDGTTWGGEFLTGDFGGFVRRGSIRPLRLPGGDKAVREIWRIGCAMLEALGEAERYPAQRAAVVREMLRLELNCPKSSGMGRLFDGVASIIGIRDAVSYEGQGATLLEAAAADSEESYPVRIERENEIYIFDHTEMTRRILGDLDGGVKPAVIAAKFMNTLVEMAAQMCSRIRADTGLDRVVLSGGSFQNMYILERLMIRLEALGFKAHCHRRVSTNDEGLSLGQTVIARSSMGV